MKKFTVKDLKAVIKDLPDDMLIVVDGYEGGIDNCEDINIIDIFINGGIGDYCGKHEKAEYWEVDLIKKNGDEEEKEKLNSIEKCLYFSR